MPGLPKRNLRRFRRRTPGKSSTQTNSGFVSEWLKECANTYIPNLNNSHPSQQGDPSLITLIDNVSKNGLPFPLVLQIHSQYANEYLPGLQTAFNDARADFFRKLLYKSQETAQTGGQLTVEEGNGQGGSAGPGTQQVDQAGQVTVEEGDGQGGSAEPGIQQQVDQGGSARQRQRGAQQTCWNADDAYQYAIDNIHFVLDRIDSNTVGIKSAVNIPFWYPLAPLDGVLNQLGQLDACIRANPNHLSFVGGQPLSFQKTFKAQFRIFDDGTSENQKANYPQFLFVSFAFILVILACLAAFAFFRPAGIIWAFYGGLLIYEALKLTEKFMRFRLVTPYWYIYFIVSWVRYYLGLALFVGWFVGLFIGNMETSFDVVAFLSGLGLLVVSGVEMMCYCSVVFAAYSSYLVQVVNRDVNIWEGVSKSWFSLFRNSVIGFIVFCIGTLIFGLIMTAPQS